MMENNVTTSPRNQVIDILRALTMLVMIFVNDFWKIHNVPHWMEHAAYKEDFLGLADLVFPIFLFVVGLSIPYALEQRHKKGYTVESTLSHILGRTLALLIMGAFIGNSESRLHAEAPYSIGIYWLIMVAAFILIWNAYPKEMKAQRGRLIVVLQWLGILLLAYLALTFSDPKGGIFAARWGILGAIGFSYLFCSVTYLLARKKPKQLIIVWLLLILTCFLNTPLREEYGAEALVNFSKPNFYNSFLALFHVGNGILPAFTMSGVLFSFGINKQDNQSDAWKLKTLFSLAIGAFLLGMITHQFWIVSKTGGTPPWLFYTLSVAIMLYIVLFSLEKYNKIGWFKIIRPAGTATLTVYLIPYVFYAFADLTGYVLPDILTHGIIGLLNCLCFGLLIIFIVGLLEKINIKLKI